MKCEKCGTDIVEGTLCDNCKDAPVANETTVNEIPKAYDPVADLMNEPVNGTVNLEKSELENSIPLGDNAGIPEMPTNENVVSVMTQVETNPTPVTPETTSVVENTVSVENNTEVNPGVQNTEVPVAQQTEKKKLSVGAIIAIVIGVIVLFVGGFFIYLRYRNVSEMLDSAKLSTFVTEVHEYMNAASSMFMSEALKPGNQGKSLEFSESSIPLDMEEKKQYKIVVDRNGNFTSVVVFDNNFCYSVSLDSFYGEVIDKSVVTIADIYNHSKNDNLNDGCHGVKSN